MCFRKKPRKAIRFQSLLFYKILRMSPSTPLLVSNLWKVYAPCLGPVLWYIPSEKAEICLSQRHRFLFASSCPCDRRLSHYLRDRWMIFFHMFFSLTSVLPAKLHGIARINYWPNFVRWLFEHCHKIKAIGISLDYQLVFPPSLWCWCCFYYPREESVRCACSVDRRVCHSRSRKKTSELWGDETETAIRKVCTSLR